MSKRFGFIYLFIFLGISQNRIYPVSSYVFKPDQISQAFFGLAAKVYEKIQKGEMDVTKVIDSHDNYLKNEM